MSKFKIGDRVKSFDGRLGTVALIQGAWLWVSYEYVDEMSYDIYGYCNPDHGWWDRPDSLVGLKSTSRLKETSNEILSME